MLYLMKMSPFTLEVYEKYSLLKIRGFQIKMATYLVLPLNYFSAENSKYFTSKN